MSVLVVEDDDGARRGLVRWLQRNAAREIVECATLAAAGAIARPVDGAIVDVRLPDGDGLELVSSLRAASPAMELMIITASTSAEVANRAHVLGAAVARKPWLEANLREFVQRLERCGERQQSLSMERAIDQLGARLRLSAQQQRILTLRAQGVRRADLADALQVAESTIRTHIRTIVTRAGVDHLDQLGWMLLALVTKDPETPNGAPKRPASSVK